MPRRRLMIALTLALGACGQSGEKKSADEVMAEAGELAKPLAGQYRTEVELLEFSVPGLPPAQADKLRSMMGNVASQASTYCLTQAEADKGFEEAIRKMTQGENGLKCAFNKFDASGTRMDAALSCTGQGGLTSQMTIGGTVAPDKSDMRMDVRQKAPMIPGGEMRMGMRMKAQRTGPCP